MSLSFYIFLVILENRMAHTNEEHYAVVSVSSDNLELNGYMCMPCNQNCINRKALNYCGICKKQFCLECRTKHAYLFKEHANYMLGKNSKWDWEVLDTYTDKNEKWSSNSLKYVEDTKELSTDDGATNNLRVVNMRVCNVKVENDRRLCSCNISSCCFLPDARIVLTDSSNRRLKLLSEDKYVMALYELPEEPHEVCYVDGNEIAVTTKGNMVMVFQITNHEIEEKGVLTFKHECWGVAYSNNQFYIGDFQSIYVYTREGKQIYLLYSNMSMGKKSVNSFAVSEDGKKIYIANYDASVLRTIDVHGKTLATLKDPCMKNPAGVCVGNNGSVFVCGVKSNSIVHVDGDGTKKLGVISKSDGLSSPQSICFNSIESTLVVCQQKNNAILVVAINSVASEALQ
ncbi:uncharacterized protein LOC123537254 [Mercenaria mercenaria]|uniref:uncharacterized protein LOC123537254 n=1 Tax=Mercenaria mercenaria TaxID=6596 RepID=UPI00234F7E49|nr:uncharacterized protein LOC123537254 [Mercenaria mercenaria]